MHNLLAMGRARDDDAPPVALRGLPGAAAAASRVTSARVDAEPSTGGAASPASAPKERADAARNRERILKAARRLVRRKPLDAICMDAIAEAAGVGKGTLYRRFPDRAALAHALLDEDTRQLQDRALAGFELPPTATSVEHVLALLGELFDFALDHGSLLVAAHERHRDVHYDHPAYAWQRTLLVGHLKLAMRRGEVPALDPLVTAELMLAGTSPELLLWLTAQTDEAQVRAGLLDTWRRALRTR